MIERRFLELEGCAAAATALAAVLAWTSSATLAMGIAAGGAWNLANLWCFSRLLAAWLGTHSRRRAIGWLAVKLAVVYPSAVVVLSAAPHLAVGFGIGFGLVLIMVTGGLARASRRPAALPTHGR